MRKTITRQLAVISCLAVLGPMAACGRAEAPSLGPSPTADVARADPPVPIVDVANASDEFDDPATLDRWTAMQGDLVADVPSAVDIGATTQGALTVRAGRMSWADTHRGFFLYRQVRGDFSVTVRVQATGRTTNKPGVDWSLTGLLLRAPMLDNGRENWIGYTVGYVRGMVTERKTTRAGRSTLRLATVDSGWIELRAVRLHSLLLLLRRSPGQGWVFEGGYSRPDLPEALQVGINAGTGLDPSDADLVSTVDWIRFSPPAVADTALQQTLEQLARTPLVDDGYGLSPSDVTLVKRDLLAYLVA